MEAVLHLVFPAWNSTLEFFIASYIGVPVASETASLGYFFCQGPPCMISAFHPPVNRQSVFFHVVVIHFLKDLERLYPQVKDPILPWDLNSPYQSLWVLGHLLELLVTYSLTHLYWKVAFLVAITSARKVSEMCGSRQNPHTQFSSRIRYNCVHSLLFSQKGFRTSIAVKQCSFQSSSQNHMRIGRSNGYTL